jgi:serine/threonine protein kinase
MSDRTSPLSLHCTPKQLPNRGKKVNLVTLGHEGQYLMPGLDNYRLVKRLSAGIVDTFIAENLSNSQEKYSAIRVFNLSVFPPQKRQETIQLLTKNCYLISKIPHHSQVAQINNYFSQEIAFYVVEEYISGHNLEVEITPGKRLSESYAIALLSNVLIPLNWLHQHNIIHGNIHPANLMRQQRGGKIILTDLGIIKQVWQLAIQPLHYQPINTKSLDYLPPNYSADRRTVDSDLYSAGAIAIQALTGLSIQQLIDPRTRELIWRDRVQISADFAYLLEKIVHPDERKRYRSAQEILLDLQAEKDNSKVTHQATIKVNPKSISVAKNQFHQPQNSEGATAIAPSNPPRSVGRLSLLAWIAANSAGISLGYYFSWVLAYLASFVLDRNLVPVIFGFSFGLIQGTSQGLVIKGMMQRGCWWVALTTIASSLGFFLGNIATGVTFGGEPVKGAILAGIWGAIAGVPQSLILRSQVSGGSGWWLTVTIAGATGGAIAIIIPMWGIAIGGIAFGIITGLYLRSIRSE